MSAAVMDGHSSRVFSLSYHPTDPNIMISAGWDDTMQVLSYNLLCQCHKSGIVDDRICMLNCFSIIMRGRECRTAHIWAWC